MKTLLLKKLTMPLVIAVLGILGAFSTMSMSSNDKMLTDMVGYRFVSEQNPCVDTQKLCSTNVGVTCKYLAVHDLWGKSIDEDDEPCLIPLYEKP